MKSKMFTILVVDDDTETLRMVSTILLAEGYKLALANDGEGALKIIEKNIVDLILLDIILPGSMDGFEVCRGLKDKPETSGIPIIFLSGLSDADIIVKGFRAGGIDYIKKPINKEELLVRVNAHIKMKFLSDELNGRLYYLEHSRSEIMKWLHSLANSIEPSQL